MYSQNFKILSLNDLNVIELKKKNDISKSYIVEYNKAFVIIFKDGTSILRPPVLGGNKGLYFDDYNDMIKIIDTKVYPISNNITFWERNKEQVQIIDSFISTNIEKLSTLLKFEVIFDDDSAYLKSLSDTINTNYKKIKRKDKDLDYYIAIYIGETIRRKNNAVWKLLPKNGFEISYIPEIVKDSTFCSHWGFVFGQLEMISYIPIELETIVQDSGKFFEFTRNRYIAD